MRCSFEAHMQLLLQQQMACRMRRPGYRAGARCTDLLLFLVSKVPVEGSCRPAFTSFSITHPPGNPLELSRECPDDCRPSSPSSMKLPSLSRCTACSMAGGHGVRHDSAAGVVLTLQAGCEAVLVADAVSGFLDTSVPCFSLAGVACSGCSFGGTVTGKPPDDSESVSICLDRRALLTVRKANPAARHSQDPLQLTAL